MWTGLERSYITNTHGSCVNCINDSKYTEQLMNQITHVFWVIAPSWIYSEVRFVTPMIPSAKPTVANIVFTWNLFCFPRFFKRLGRTYERDCRSAEWIKKWLTCAAIRWSLLALWGFCQRWIIIECCEESSGLNVRGSWMEKRSISICSCCCSSGAHSTNFANVEDMLFEVFRCEETDSIDRIAIAQFLRVSEKYIVRSCNIFT